MKQISLNNGWLFSRGSGTALERTINGAADVIPVTLPHDAMIGEKRDPNAPGGNASGYYPALYERICAGRHNRLDLSGV